MSRSRTCRPILSAKQRAAIERELRRDRLDEFPTLLAGADRNGEPPVVDIPRTVSSVGDLRASLGAGADTLVSLKLLQAECSALTRQAATAGIDSGEIEPILTRIDELLILAGNVPLDDMLSATDDVYADTAALETYVVDTINEVRTLRLARVAVTRVLGRMGFDLTEEVHGDDVRVRGTRKARERAEVSIGGHPPCIDLVTGEPTAVARALRHEDDQPRLGAVDLAVELHTMIEREMKAAGLGVGRVEAVTRKQPASKLRQTSPPQGPAKRTTSGRRRKAPTSDPA